MQSPTCESLLLTNLTSLAKTLFYLLKKFSTTSEEKIVLM